MLYLVGALAYVSVSGITRESCTPLWPVRVPFTLLDQRPSVSLPTE